MRQIGTEILLSASDLMRFMGCAHATTLDLAFLNGSGPKPREANDEEALLQKHGDAHEVAHLERLRKQGKSVVEVRRD